MRTAPPSITNTPSLQAVLVQLVNADPVACDLLATLQDNFFCEVVQTITDKLCRGGLAASFSPGDKIVYYICLWAGNAKAAPPLELNLAIVNRHRNRVKRRNKKRMYINTFGLHRGPAMRDQYLSTIPTLSLPRLARPYPPAGYSVYETLSAGRKWRHFLHVRKQHDSRTRKRPLMMLDPNKLNATIGADESRIIRDDKGQLVGLVLRDFCVDRDVLDWVNQTIARSAGLRKSIRVWSHNVCANIV